MPGSVLCQGTGTQSIQFLPIADRQLNSAPFQVVALSSAYLPVTLTVTGPATLSGRLVTLTGPGTVTIDAQQAGNTQYAATEGQISFQSLPVAPAISWAPPSITYGTPLSASLLNATALAPSIVDPSADLTTVSSQLSNSVLNPGQLPNYLAASGIFRYEGSTVGPLSSAVDAPYVSNGVPAPYGLDFDVAFTCDCQQFEFALQADGDFYRLWVDGAYTSLDYTLVPTSVPNVQFILVKFPDKRSRQIKIFDHYNDPFYGIYTTAGDTITAPQVPIGKNVMIFGDSWTGPTIVQPVLPPPQDGENGSGYPQTLGQFFNWNFWDDGIGGSGFSQIGTDTLGRNFAQRIETDVCPHPFDAIVLLGGTDDGGTAEAPLQADVSTALSELASCEPGAPVYLYGPQFQQAPIDQAIQAAAAAATGSVSYTDMGAAGWFYGSTTSAATGNAYLYFNAHPTPLGHDYLAEKIALDILTKFPSLTPAPYALSSPAPVVGSFTYTQPVGTILPAGNNTVSADFNPQDTTNIATAEDSATLVVTKATTSLELSSSMQNGMIGFTATVAPQIAGVPTGTVTFLSNGVSFGTAQLVNGTVTDSFPSSAIAPGNDTITASYGGDPNFLGSSAQAGILVMNVPPDFSFTLPNSTVTLVPGASTTVKLTIAPIGGLTGPVQAACTGLPANAGCSLADTTLAANQGAQSATLTIQSFVTAAALHPGVNAWTQGGKTGAAALCCLAGLFPVWRRRRILRRFACMLLALFAVSTVGALTGCGSSAKIVDAAPGTYTVQVALTSNSGTAQAITHTQTLTLVLP